jgi:hypothetical protein
MLWHAAMVSPQTCRAVNLSLPAAVGAFTLSQRVLHLNASEPLQLHVRAGSPF